MKRNITFYLGGIILFSLAAVAGVEATSSPRFCSSCHEIRPAVESWKTNPHKDIKCLSCHADPGTIGLLKRKFAAYREIYGHFAGKYPKDLRARVNFENCVICHTGGGNSPDAKNIVSGKVSFNHRDIIDAKTSCLQCHQRVAHGSLPSGDVEEKE